jgi:hypothetical protein
MSTLFLLGRPLASGVLRIIELSAFLLPAVNGRASAIWGTRAPNMGRAFRCGGAAIERRWTCCTYRKIRRIMMFYMQEKVVHSIQQERHREADVERLSGQSRLPARLRRHSFSIPPFASRSTGPSAASIPRPAAGRFELCRLQRILVIQMVAVGVDRRISVGANRVRFGRGPS